MGLAKNSRQSIEPQMVTGKVFKNMDLARFLCDIALKIWIRAATNVSLRHVEFVKGRRANSTTLLLL
jgi:hypothetical protein